MKRLLSPSMKKDDKMIGFLSVLIDFFIMMLKDDDPYEELLDALPDSD